MKIAKDGIRSKVRVGFDGRVYKTFRGTDSDKRFANEVKVLRVLEARGCDFVPRLLEADEDSLTIVTTNAGHPISRITEGKANELFDRLKNDFGVIHDDPFTRNITYHPQAGHFFIIDFELAQILDSDNEVLTTLKLEWCGRTREGYRKPGNDDALAAFASREGWAHEQPLDGCLNLQDEGIVCSVSDGMGGVKGGGFASYLVVSELRRFLPARMGSFKNAADPLSLLDDSIRDLHDHVNRMAAARPEFEGMGATLVCGLFYHSEMHFVHVGDSRIYRYRAGKLEQITFDHTRVGDMLRKGKINEREARGHPSRSVLSMVIGGKCRTVDPQVGTLHLEAGDWFLFCSDGLIDGLWDKNIREEFEKSDREGRSVKGTAEAMLEEAVEVAGRDDTTLFVVHVTKTGLEEISASPSEDSEEQES